MSKDISKKGIPAGFSVVGEGKFFKFEKPGDSFQGYFLGLKEQKSQKFKNIQTLIIARHSVNEELYLVPVKTSIRDKILELEEGIEFYLMYVGDKTSASGQVYKDFVLAISKVPF